MKRGEERAEFNKKLKEKEEMLKEIKKQVRRKHSLFIFFFLTFPLI